MTFSAAFANAFLCAFLLDCALTVVDGLTSALGATPLRGARDVIAGFVFWGALLLALVATFASRLPRLRLLLLAAGTWWVNLDAPPLGPLLPGPVRDVVLGLVQAALAAPALHWIRRESGGSAWLFRERFLPPARPGRRRALALALVAAPLVLALGAAGCAVYVVECQIGERQPALHALAEVEQLALLPERLARGVALAAPEHRQSLERSAGFVAHRQREWHA